MSDLTEDVPGLAAEVARLHPGSVAAVEVLAPARSRTYSEAARVTLPTGRFVVLAARRDGSALVSTGGVPYREHALYTAPWRFALEVAHDVVLASRRRPEALLYTFADLAVAERLVDLLPADYPERLESVAVPGDPFHAVHLYVTRWEVATRANPRNGFENLAALLRELESGAPIEWAARRVRGAR